MAGQAQVVIVGGGVMGASLAFHLAAAGARDVHLLERNFIASDPTGYSSALVRQHYSIELYARMAYESFLFYRDFAERLHGGECGFVRCGLVVAFGPENAHALRDAVRMRSESASRPICSRPRDSAISSVRSARMTSPLSPTSEPPGTPIPLPPPGRLRRRPATAASGWSRALAVEILSEGDRG
jgi:glycine/D-amino acid oxidase-like deaminating enzyme